MLLDSFETKEKVLGEFLKICAFEGWNNASLTQAVAKCGIPEKFADIIFEGGCVEVSQFYIESQNQKLARELQKIPDFAAQKIRDKIRLALYLRFEIEKENRLALQRLINFYADPRNFANFEIGVKPAMQAVKDCYKIADFIWKEINDQSTDFNFYTKRLTLGKIVLRSLFVFLKDDSENLTTTKNFVDSQIAKVMKFEQYKSKAKKIISGTFLNEEGLPKSPKEIIKNLPFFRLIKS